MDNKHTQKKESTFDRIMNGIPVALGCMIVINAISTIAFKHDIKGIELIIVLIVSLAIGQYLTWKGHKKTETTDTNESI